MAEPSRESGQRQSPLGEQAQEKKKPRAQPKKAASAPQPQQSPQQL